tara:strand:- start:821 stop:1027 length:207 start_codon:yes stop_codon:yes gene_type:complete
MIEILVITFESGLKKFIPKSKKALDYIVEYFDMIEEIESIQIDECFSRYKPESIEEKKPEILKSFGAN